MDKNAIRPSGWPLGLLAVAFAVGCVPAIETQRMFCWTDVKTGAMSCTPILPGQIQYRRIGSAGYGQPYSNHTPTTSAAPTPSSAAASPSGVAATGNGAAASSAGAVATGAGSSAAASSAGAVATGSGSAAAASSAGVTATSGGSSAAASSAGVAVSN